MTTEVEAQEMGIEMGAQVMAAIADWQANSPRTKQSTARKLGMSEMAGCREYVRASINGDPKAPTPDLKWPAFLGTAIGDKIESIMGEMGFATQEDAVLRMPGLDVTVSGHLDLRDAHRVGDLKTRNGLADVRREGPPFKEKAQISGYLVAKIQEGVLDENAVGVLIYLDRSGADKSVYTWAVTYKVAQLVLEGVRERLLDVARALAAGESQGYLRDEPESYCYHIQCPFYNACWDGYTPTGKLDHPRTLDAVRRKIEARDDEKDAKSRGIQARDDLRGVEGIVSEGPHKGTVVRWTLSQSEGGTMSERLDVR